MKVFITREIPESAEKLLKARGFEVTVYRKEDPIPRKELLLHAKDADGIISLLTEKFDKDLIDQIPRCKVIANYAVGFNNIDVEYAAEKGITVTNTPDVLTDATADIAMALVLSCSRRIIEGEKIMRSKKFKGWKPKLLLGPELKGKFFGIMGAGRIGSAVARRAKAFGTNILYYDHSENEQLEQELDAKKVSLNVLLKKSDFISLHLPFTPKTYHLLDKEHLNLMKPSSIFINTARGEIVEEKELINMLRQKKIFAAGFDVYEGEPAVNPQLLKLQNVVLLPHIGSASIEARNRMAMLAAGNVIAVLKGRDPLTPVKS
jgi:glyoxylate reductase